MRHQIIIAAAAAPLDTLGLIGPRSEMNFQNARRDYFSIVPLDHEPLLE